MENSFYIFIGISVLVAVLIVVRMVFFYKNFEKLKKEKQQGKVRFIDEEYLAYLESYTDESVQKTENLELTFIPNKQHSYTLKATLYGNAAGVFIDFHPAFATMAIDSLFFFGEKSHAGFIPRATCYVHHIENTGNDFHLTGSFSKNASAPQFYLHIKNAPFQVMEALRKLPIEQS